MPIRRQRLYSLCTNVFSTSKNLTAYYNTLYILCFPESSCQQCLDVSGMFAQILDMGSQLGDLVAESRDLFLQPRNSICFRFRQASTHRTSNATVRA